MSDDEATGFGGDDSEEDTGFGEEEFEEEGFGEGFESEEENEGFGEDVEFGKADEDEEEEDEKVKKQLPKIEKQKTPGEAFKAFGSRYFKGYSPSYDLNPIVSPLLKIENSVSVRAAIDSFRLVCQFMGITAIVGKSKLTALDGVQRIVSYALSDDALKDEIYCQIMKQWTDNPSPTSRARGTILLGLSLGCFAPSQKLIPVLRQFILEGPAGFIPFCNLLLRRTLHNGTRLAPPCYLELQAVKKKQIMRVNVIIDLCTGDTANARLDPASTANEWVAEICNQIGIKNTYGWMIYIDRFGKLISLRGGGDKGQHIMDAISTLDKEAFQRNVPVKDALNVSGQFSFRKEMFEPKHWEKCDRDPVATHAIFHQIQFMIKRKQLVPPDPNDYNTLAASMYFSLYGDDVENGKLTLCLKAWLPDSEFERMSIKDRIPVIEKIHAKATYSRENYNKAKTEAEVIKYALEKWGKTNSFSSDGGMMLRTR